jgi:transcriptional regulator with XRE-family HTH domain
MLTDHIQEQLLSFGSRLRALRRNKGWTLDALSNLSGLSKGYLSRLESGDRQASIAAALTLARLFQVSLAQLFESEEPEPFAIVRRGGSVPVDANGLRVWPLSNGSSVFQLQPMRVVIPPNRDGNEHQSHEGEEWIYILSGSLTLSLADEDHVLQAGDAAHFDSRLPHRLIARSGAEAEILMVAAPPPAQTAPLPS